jgi:hypothetical protein
LQSYLARREFAGLGTADLRFGFTHPVWSKAIFEPEMLSDEEMVVADRILRANGARVMRLEVLYQLGFDLFDPTAVAAVTVFDYLGTEFGMAWWDNQTQAPNLTYTKTMNQILESLPNHSTYEKDYLNRIREKISKSQVDHSE